MKLLLFCSPIIAISGCGSGDGVSGSAGALSSTFEQARQKHTKDLPAYSDKDKPNAELLQLENSMRVAERSQDWPRVEQNALRLLQIRDQWLGPQSTDSAQSAATAARALREQGKLPEALRVVTERLGLLQSAHPQRVAPSVVLLLSEQSRIYRELKQNREAVQAIGAAISARKNIAQDIHSVPELSELEAQEKELIRAMGGKS